MVKKSDKQNLSKEAKEQVKDIHGIPKLFEKEDYDKIHAAIDEILKINKNNMQALLFKSEIYYRQGKIVDSEEIAEKCLNIDPNNSTAHYLRALSFYEMDKLEKANHHVDEALKFKENFNFVILKANILKREGKDHSELLSKAEELNPARFEEVKKFFE